MTEFKIAMPEIGGESQNWQRLADSAIGSEQSVEIYEGDSVNLEEDSHRSTFWLSWPQYTFKTKGTA